MVAVCAYCNGDNTYRFLNHKPVRPIGKGSDRTVVIVGEAASTTTTINHFLQQYLSCTPHTNRSFIREIQVPALLPVCHNTEKM